MRVGIICEGSTDFAVLESLALELISADECILLQPDFDKLRGGDTTFGPGWQGVRKFLQTSAPGLAIGTFDVVVVQVDASIRNTDAIKRLDLPAPSADEPELSALCSHVKSWAKGGLPSSAVVALPREE